MRKMENGNYQRITQSACRLWGARGLCKEMKDNGLHFAQRYDRAAGRDIKSTLLRAVGPGAEWYGVSCDDGAEIATSGLWSLLAMT